MRTDPRLLLRGLGKFVAVVLAAGLAGAGIGIGLAKLSGNDASNDAVPPATSSTTQTTSTPTATTSTGTTATTPAKAVYRVPRLEVLSSELGPVSESTGRAVVTVRVRFTNRGNRAVEIKTPALLSQQDEVPLDSDEREAAGALLRAIDPAQTATGTLRFDVPSAIAQRLTATPTARLRVGNRTVTVRLTAPSAG